MNAPNVLQKQNDYRNSYLINFEIGLIVSLLIFLGLFKMKYNPEDKIQLQTEKQEIVKMEEVVQTKQQEQPPAPPRPQSPIEVPNDEIVQEDNINFSSEIDLGSALDLPEPPPSADEEKKEPEEKIFVVVEKMPQLIGGLANLQSKIEYPDMARMAGIEGRVIVQFTISKKGEVMNPTVIRGIGGGCDEEAVRVIKTAHFTPGMQRGHPVNVRYTMPIRFALQKSTS